MVQAMMGPWYGCLAFVSDASHVRKQDLKSEGPFVSL